MSIRNWPELERPREKLLQSGAQALSDAELLAIFLRTGIPGCSAVDLARHVLEQAGGLRALLEIEQTAFCAMRGLGKAKYAHLKAALEMARRHLQQGLAERDAIRNPEDTKQLLALKLRHKQREVFATLLLNNQHHVLAYEELFYGGIHSAYVHIREVVKCAMRHNAAALIVAHNHPSGEAKPSTADIEMTRQLKNALELVEVRLLDHLVVGHGDIFSLAELGVL